jgi:hypothetical protein
MFFVKKGIFAQGGHLARLEEFHTDVSIFAPQINYPRFTEMHTDVAVYSYIDYPRFTEMHTDVAIYEPNPPTFGELVSSFGQSPDFEPMFREFVSSFGVAQPQGGVSVDGLPLSLDGDLITFN